MNPHLRVTLVTKSGARYEGVRVHGAGGPLPEAGGWKRLQKRLGKPGEILIWTAWTTTEWSHVKVRVEDIAEIECCEEVFS